MADELAFALEQYREYKDKKDSLNQEVKILRQRMATLEEVIMVAMQDEGVDKVSKKGVGTATLKTDEYPKIEDWQAFVQFIRDVPDAMHLLKKDIKSAAWREEIEAGREIPGVGSYTKTKVNFRRLT